MFKRNTDKEKSILIVEILFIVAIFVSLFTSLKNIDTESSKEGLKQLETSVRRSAIACYASEGVYPPDIQYLEDNYGLIVDDSRYVVRYSVFAENIMPDITVLERSNG